MESQYKRLTDSQGEFIKEILPVQRKRKYSLRDIVDAILWVYALVVSGGTYRIVFLNGSWCIIILASGKPWYAGQA